ncbi:MAG TPA: PAS domain S-box protein [Syntrophales bacterium]|nr:PAS domain S-box protein [Syntrophales bacterium]
MSKRINYEIPDSMASWIDNSSPVRQGVDEKLLEREQLFRSLTETSLAAAFIVQGGKFRYINTSAIAYADYTAEELIGKDSYTIVHPDDREMVKKKARDVLHGVDDAPYEFRMVTKQGAIRHVIQIVSPIQYNGRPAILGNAIDVTRRRKAEEALRESERRLSDIIDFLPDATLAIDLQGKVIAWNHAIEEMTGVKAADILGKGGYEYALPFYGIRRPILIDLVLKPDKKIEKSYYSILEKNKDLLIVETWVPFLKWKKAFLWAKASPLYNSKGDIVGAIESIRDITERKEAERRLQESEEKYRSLASGSDLMYLVDKDCKYLFMNDGLLSRIGIALNDVEGKSYGDFHSEADAREFSEIVRHIFKMGHAVQHEHRSQRDDRYFLRSLSPVRDSEGQTIAVTVVSKDITKRKRAEEALRESERRLSDIIDFLPDATLAVDRKGKVIAWNRAIEEMTGVKASEMLGKANHEYALPFYGVRRPILIDLVLKPDKKTERNYYPVFKKQENRLIVETWVPFPGFKDRKAFLWATASPLYDSKGRIVGAIESIRDITERKQAQEMLEKREVELEAKTNELEDLNAALRVLLKQREEDRNELEQKVLSNVKLLILPYIEKLKNRTDVSSSSYVNVLESNLKEIVSPFAQKLSVKYLNLTNREVQIANLIKEGKTTKEIAALLNVSESAVNVYRYHIRRKLSLTKKHNLRSYLST